VSEAGPGGACPLSTRGGTRLVRLVLGRKGGGAGRGARLRMQVRGLQHCCRLAPESSELSGCAARVRPLPVPREPKHRAVGRVGDVAQRVTELAQDLAR